jgi:hypothetical protein
MYGSIMGSIAYALATSPAAYGMGPAFLPRLHRPGTALDYKRTPNRWPNGHKQLRQTKRLLQQRFNRAVKSYNRLPDDGYGRVLVGHSVSGHLFEGAIDTA